MFKKVLSVGLLAMVGGCQCLPGLPECLTCGIGETVMNTLTAPLATAIQDFMESLINVG